MSHLLVTNDFPPKVGGIQSLLWEWWRRLPPERVTVLTTPYDKAAEFDARSPIRIVRSKQKVLLPTRAVRDEILALVRETQADLVVLDPALPLGWLGPSLARRGVPYAVVLHGAEVTVPGRLPITKALLSRVLRGSIHVIAAGNYPLAEAERAAGCSLSATVIPCGVDTHRLRPVADEAERNQLRCQLGLPLTNAGPLVVSASRLVPRKGMDRLIDAAAILAPELPGLVVAISGSGRDHARLERRVADRAKHTPIDVRLMGRLSDDDLAALYRCGDLYAMVCRNRWFGLEQEGFGIVFVEAAASGVAQMAGASGGAADAVLDGVTGRIVACPRDARAVAGVRRELLSDRAALLAMGQRSRARAVAELDNDRLAQRLGETLAELEAAARSIAQAAGPKAMHATGPDVRQDRHT